MDENRIKTLLCDQYNKIKALEILLDSFTKENEQLKLQIQDLNETIKFIKACKKKV